MIDRAQRQRGFSLAEVLVAVALLAVILLALFGLVTAGVRRAYSGKKMTEATIIAEHVLQRMNTYAPQGLFGTPNMPTPACTSSNCTVTWSRTGATTTPAVEGGTSTNEIERNAIRDLLVTADLPASTAKPATLTISVTGVTPTGTADFDVATMERVLVTVSWWEWGTRQKQVRLQALNLRSLPTTTN